MQSEVPAERRQCDTGAEQECGGMDRAARDNHRRCADGDAMRSMYRLDSRGHTAFDHYPPDLAVHDHPRAVLGGVRQIGDEGRLLGRPTTTKPAVAARIIL
jgi:hypothetical protein